MARNAAKQYEENPDLYTGYNHVKTGKMLALIGIILSILYIIALIITFSVYGIEGLTELQQEMMREMESR